MEPQSKGVACKLTPERHQLFCDAIRAGATYYLAAATARITYNTYRNWMWRGEQELEKNPDAEPDTLSDFVKFYMDVKLAEAECSAGWLAQISAAATDPARWQAAAWLLERRFLKEYGRTATVLTGEDGGPIEVNTRIRVVEVMKDNRDPDADFDRLADTE